MFSAFTENKIIEILFLQVFKNDVRCNKKI